MTTNTMELISMVESLPVDIKTILVEKFSTVCLHRKKRLTNCGRWRSNEGSKKQKPGKLWQRVISHVVVVGGLRVPLGVANPPRPLNALSTI